MQYVGFNLNFGLVWDRRTRPQGRLILYGGSSVLVLMEVSLNYCSQNGGNLYRAPYYNRNLNIGPRINSNLGQSPNHLAMTVFDFMHAVVE